MPSTDFDLNAYLERIAYRGPLDPSVVLLTWALVPGRNSLLPPRVLIVILIVLPEAKGCG